MRCRVGTHASSKQEKRMTNTVHRDILASFEQDIEKEGYRATGIRMETIFRSTWQEKKGLGATDRHMKYALTDGMS
jgi:hypothetical protein